MKMISAWPTNIKIQKGVALLAGLLLLSALSLLAVTAATGMVQQQRMSGNYEDKQFSHQASILALAKGEQFLYLLEPHHRDSECNDDCYLPPLDNIIHQLSEQNLYPELETNSWWNSRAWEAGLDPVTGLAAGDIWQFNSRAPRFFIEELHFKNSSSISALC